MRTRARSPERPILPIGLLVLAAGCQQILGIEDWTPRQTSGGGGAGGAGSGGAARGGTGGRGGGGPSDGGAGADGTGGMGAGGDETTGGTNTGGRAIDQGGGGSGEPEGGSSQGGTAGTSGRGGGNSGGTSSGSGSGGKGGGGASTGGTATGGKTNTGGVGTGGKNTGGTSTGGTTGGSNTGGTSTGGTTGGVGTGGKSTGGSIGTGGTGGVACSGTGPCSCETLSNDCGPNNDESCCVSPTVTGATFYRGYDGYDHKSKSSPATISNFRLDRFEVTVGRFRRFVAAWNGGWRPAAGSGKHTHLNGGKGLTDSSGAAAYEPGWSSSWDSSVAPTDTNLNCGASKTWTTSAASNERLPIVCQNWYEAYAFCIWDDGFLPSEAEWNYAAAGGTDQRRYPWSTAQDPTTIDCTYANYLGNGGARCVAAGASVVGARSPKGDGKYGQADLGGNAWEPTLDWYAEYAPTCIDCAYLTVSPYRMQRGGYFDFSELYIDTARRDDAPPTGRYDIMGVRCARAP